MKNFLPEYLWIDVTWTILRDISKRHWTNVLRGRNNCYSVLARIVFYFISKWQTPTVQEKVFPFFSWLFTYKISMCGWVRVDKLYPCTALRIIKSPDWCLFSFVFLFWEINFFNFNIYWNNLKIEKKSYFYHLPFFIVFSTLSLLFLCYCLII